MEKTQSIWFDGALVDWDDAKIHVLSHALHYGSSVFEGIRFYKTDKGPAIFRLQEHVDRLFYSAESLFMEIPYTSQEIFDAIVETVAKNGVEQGYIRPICMHGYGKMGISPVGAEVNTAIAVLPWGAYLPERPIKVKVSKYIRIHPQSSITDAKIGGHYINSILSHTEVKKEGYDEALLLDYEGNVAEGPGENIFMVKDGKLYTPPLGTILSGITRNAVMKIASDMGIEVQEKKMTLQELKDADEVFFTGTAAEVTAIGIIDETTIANGEIGETTAKIKEFFHRIVTGKEPQYESWLTYTS